LFRIYYAIKVHKLESNKLKTALSILSQRLALTEVERSMLNVLLTCTPLAIKGDETLAPMTELKQCVVGDDRSQEGVVAAVRVLLGMKRVENASRSISFSIVSDAEWVENASFLQFRLNPTFLGFLRQIAERESIPIC
jgi:hypothetical protein